MGFKTLFEKFGEISDLGETNLPFDFEGPANGGQPVIVLSSPEQQQSSGATISMPHIPSTRTVEVIEEPETFRGELPHLAPEEHEAVIQWFDKASLDESIPTEVRLFLVELAVKLKLDAKKRIVPSEKPSEEGKA